MNQIITTTEVQQKIGQITSSIGERSYIVTNKGKGKIVMLPYFEGCDENVSDYMEDYEMAKNREKLKESYKESSNSGKSSFQI